jgi:hypothetical protein
MRTRILLLFIVCTFTTSLFAQHKEGFSQEVKARVLPALFKTTQGLMQKLEVIVPSEVAGVEAVLKLDGQVKNQRLEKGNNKVCFDLPAVSKSRTLKLHITQAKAKQTLKIKLKPVRQWQMNFVQHSHTDIGYTRSQTEILAEHLRYIDYALDYCDATDHLDDASKFRWTCEISWAVSEYLKCRPTEQIERLKQRVKEGRIELAGMYLNFDELPDEQTLAASLYPLKQFRDAGLKSEIVMQNDVNGIGWCFSEYFADAGIKYVNMGTHGHRALICFDKPTVFWWESPSGKKILTYRAEHYNQGNFFGVETDNFALFEERLLTYLDQMEAKNYPFDLLVAQHSGYFTDNSPPSTKSGETIAKWNAKYEWPKLRTAVASEFFKEVETKYPDKIETIRGAWPDWWTDGFGSGAREAAVSRITHADIIAIQGGLSFAKMLGSKLPANINEQVDEVNKALLFYDEHTFGFSESVRNPYGRETWEQRSLKQSYAWEAYRRTGQVGEVAKGLLQTYVPKTTVPSVAVFNTLNWKYSGIAKLYIDHQILPKTKAFEILDANGNIVPAQPGESRSDGTYWSLFVKDVPALGYAQYTIHVKDAKKEEVEAARTLHNPTIENEWYKIVFNLNKGTISSLFDKEQNKEILSDNPEWELGEFIYETIDSRHTMEQYKRPKSTRLRPETIQLESVEKGPIWNAYRFRGETVAGREPKNLMVEYRIFNVDKKIEILYSLRKKAVTDPEAIYIAFPFEVEAGKIHLDVPGGTIEAGVDQIPGSSNDWYTVQNFATARNDQYQVVMGSSEIPLMQFGAINTGRYTAGAVPQSTNMYSWPMNNYWVTNFNADQMGEMSWSYFISSSNDNSIQHATQFAWENRVPFITRVLPAAKNAQAVMQSASILDIVPDNLLLIKMIPVKGEQAVLLQMREIGGVATDFAVKSDKIAIKQVQQCDVLGDPIQEGTKISFNPWENKFIKIAW